MNVWQIACGENGLRYDDLFLKHDVMFCGPGRFGPYEKQAYSDLIDAGRETAEKVSIVRRFATTVHAGDIVLLRFGQRVIAIGVVADDEYEHTTTFDDVDGWDLEHSRRVIWQHQLSEELQAIQSDSGLFAAQRQGTFSIVNAETVIEPIRHLFDRCEERELVDMPAAPSDPLTEDELGQALFDKGLAYDTTHRVCQAIARIRRLIDWYKSSSLAPNRPAEHEVVAHVILPLLMRT